METHKVHETLDTIAKLERYAKLGDEIVSVIEQRNKELNVQIDLRKQILESQKSGLMLDVSGEFYKDFVRAYNHGITCQEVDVIRGLVVERESSGYAAALRITEDEAKTDLEAHLRHGLPFDGQMTLAARYAMTTIVMAMKTALPDAGHINIEAFDAKLRLLSGQYAQEYATEANIPLDQAQAELSIEIKKNFDKQEQEERGRRLKEHTERLNKEADKIKTDKLRTISTTDQIVAKTAELEAQVVGEDLAHFTADLRRNTFRLYDLLADLL